MGCSQVSEGSMIEELEFKIDKLELAIDKKDAQIEKLKEEYELRNILDIKTRKILSALNRGEFSSDDAELLYDNVQIKEDKLVFSVEDFSSEIQFFDGELDFEHVRQRFYLLNEQERFITGYEIFNNTSDRAVLIFTFIKPDDSDWKLIDIGIDR